MVILRVTFIAFIFALFSCKAKVVGVEGDVRNGLYELYNPSSSPDDVFHRRVLKTAGDYDSYRLQNLRALLDGLNSIIKITQDDYFIQQQMSLIDYIVNSARVSSEIPENNSPFKDDYRGWVSLDRSRLYGEEIVLNEGYAFFYIAEFLNLQKDLGWIFHSSANLTWWEQKVDFLEKHIWTKWYTRSKSYHGNPHRYFLRSRTHMGSHWAGIAMYLESISSDVRIQYQCNIVRQAYDFLLRKNMRPHLLDTNAYIWNSTYDDVTGTFAVRTKSPIVQDVSHGNHVVSYVVAAYEFGSENWNKEDILKLCNTLKLIYNPKSNSFADNLDRSPDLVYPGRGNFLADGWVKLAKYDEDLYDILLAFSKDTKILSKFRQELQFLANLTYSQY